MVNALTIIKSVTGRVRLISVWRAFFMSDGKTFMKCVMFLLTPCLSACGVGREAPGQKVYSAVWSILFRLISPKRQALVWLRPFQ